MTGVTLSRVTATVETDKFQIRGVEWIRGSRPNSDFNSPDFTVEMERFNPLCCDVRNAQGDPVLVKAFTITIRPADFAQVALTLHDGTVITCDIDPRSGPLQFGAVREKVS